MSSHEQARALAFEILSGITEYPFPHGTTERVTKLIAAALTQSTPQWTSERPVKEGWYWWDIWDRPEIVHIIIREDGELFMLCMHLASRPLENCIGGQWSGPLTPPEERAS